MAAVRFPFLIHARTKLVFALLFCQSVSFVDTQYHAQSHFSSYHVLLHSVQRLAFTDMIEANRCSASLPHAQSAATLPRLQSASGQRCTRPLHIVSSAQFVWLNGLVVSALGIQARGPGFDSRVVPLFHWLAATLDKLFTHIASPVSQLQETGVQKGVFGA